MTQAGPAIVTGASRGIGRAIAKRLAADGYAVLVNYVSNREAAEEVVREIVGAGGQAVHMAGDVTRRETAAELFDRATDEFGQVRVLVNNAGVGLHKWTPMVDTDDDSYNHIMDVNVRGTFNMLREAARRMEEGGRIVNISSALVQNPLPGLSLYTAAKAAVESFSKTLAFELRGRNITVNCVAPGATATEVFLQGKSDETVQRIADLSPFGRIGSPEDIAAAVAFLVGPDGTWVDGQILRLNGGAS